MVNTDILALNNNLNMDSNSNTNTNTNINIYEYDKYDIIDFLEPEYIKDWLSIIPNSEWIKYKNTIETVFHKLTDKTIISFVIQKIKLNLPKYIKKNFSKINLELLKYCVEDNFVVFKNEIKMNLYSYKMIIYDCIRYHDYEFNKYFYEKIYFKLEPEHEIKQSPSQSQSQSPSLISKLINMFEIIPINNIHKDNMFHEYFVNTNNINILPDYKILKYYSEKFKKIYTNIKNYKSYSMYFEIFSKSKIDNFDDMIDLKNILAITDVEFKNNIIFGTTYGNNIISYICKFYDINFIVKTINYYLIPESITILTKENVRVIMTFTSLSNDIEKVFLVYNYLVYEKNFVFTKELYSEIIKKLISSGGKHCKYKDIIFEFINLGGNVSGLSTYVDYMEKIKIYN